MSDPPDPDPSGELDVLRTQLDRVAVTIVALAPAPERLTGDAALCWHLASGALARLTDDYLGRVAEQIGHMQHALDLGRTPCEVVYLAAYRQLREERARGGSRGAANDAR